MSKNACVPNRLPVKRQCARCPATFTAMTPRAKYCPSCRRPAELEKPRVRRAVWKEHEETGTARGHAPTGAAERPCARCETPFTPTIQRRMLCADCFRSVEG